MINRRSLIKYASAAACIPIVGGRDASLDWFVDNMHVAPLLGELLRCGSLKITDGPLVIGRWNIHAYSLCHDLELSTQAIARWVEQAVFTNLSAAAIPGNSERSIFCTTLDAKHFQRLRNGESSFMVFQECLHPDWRYGSLSFNPEDIAIYLGVSKTGSRVDGSMRGYIYTPPVRLV